MNLKKFEEKTIQDEWNVIPNYYFTMTRDTEAYRSELKRVRSSIDI